MIVVVVVVFTVVVVYIIANPSSGGLQVTQIWELIKVQGSMFMDSSSTSVRCYLTGKVGA